MQTQKKFPRWILAFVAIIVPLTLIMGAEFHISERFVIPAFIIAMMMFGTMMMWRRANSNATGQEWWQDDTSAGWHSS